MPVVVLFKSESDQPDKFVKVLEEKNFDVRSIHCLSFQFTNQEKLREKLRRFDDYEGIIFTSQRSVQAVQKATEENSENILSGWMEKRNYSVGESTSEFAQSLLNLGTDGKESGNAQNLASLMIRNHNGIASKPFLFPSGNLKQDILEMSLKRHAINVESLEVYQTIQHPNLDESIEDLKTTKIDFIVYFSPSGIKFSLPILKKYQIELSVIKMIAIGPSTKKVLDENDLQCFRMCTKPSPESLLEALSS